MLQLNLCSFKGYYGRRSREKAERIIELKDAEDIFYGTDVHSSPEKMDLSENINKLARNFEFLG